MMVCFTRRSRHTQRMPDKPIAEGYKIFALCEHGYTYAWAYYSRVDSFLGFHRRFPGPHPDGPNQPLELTPTSRMFFWLCMTLPWKWRRFVVFCDNYFSNVPLFRALLVYGIAACGTARPNSAGHPKVLKQVEKKRVTWRVGRCLGKLLRFSEQSGRIKRSYVFSRRPSIFLPTWGTLLRFYDGALVYLNGIVPTASLSSLFGVTKLVRCSHNQKLR
jgi:hypothetical protein